MGEDILKVMTFAGAILFGLVRGAQGIGPREAAEDGQNFMSELNRSLEAAALERRRQKAAVKN